MSQLVCQSGEDFLVTRVESHVHIVKTFGFDQGTGLKTAMLLAIIVVGFSVAYAAPSAGTCMCSTTNGLNARDAGTFKFVLYLIPPTK